MPARIQAAISTKINVGIYDGFRNSRARARTSTMIAREAYIF
jgi:hypothetical protein